MCDKAILEDDERFKSVPGSYKNQQICDKAVDNYPHALEFVPECYKAQKMCGRVIDTHPSAVQKSLWIFSDFLVWFLPPIYILLCTLLGSFPFFVSE